MGGALTIDRVGIDRYGRTLAWVAGERGDLSCCKLSRGQAVYKASWDSGYAMARICPEAILQR